MRRCVSLKIRAFRNSFSIDNDSLGWYIKNMERCTTKKAAKEYLKELEEQHRLFFKVNKYCYEFNESGKCVFTKPEYKTEYDSLMKKIGEVNVFLVPKSRQKGKV